MGEEGGISHDQASDQKQKSLTLNKENFSTVQGSTILVLKAYPRNLKGVKVPRTNTKSSEGFQNTTHRSAVKKKNHPLYELHILLK